jgi:hypothetical protein
MPCFHQKSTIKYQNNRKKSVMGKEFFDYKKEYKRDDSINHVSPGGHLNSQHPPKGEEPSPSDINPEKLPSLASAQQQSASIRDGIPQ